MLTDLLHSVQMIGAQGQNAFSDVTKLSELGRSDVRNDNPVYGFKSNLIRLIGNLAYRDRSNQDAVSRRSYIRLSYRVCVRSMCAKLTACVRLRNYHTLCA